MTIAPLTAPRSESSPFQTAVFRVAPGGRIVRHPASDPQILAVLEGAGEVSGQAGVDEPIEAGEAVFWQAGEEHEVKTATGLTALIIEGDGLEPFRKPLYVFGRVCGVCVRVRVRAVGKRAGRAARLRRSSKGRLRPMHARRPLLEPGRLEEEDESGDHDLGEPADDEEQRCEHDPPEAELGQADRGPEVEHVPGEPEDDRPNQDHHQDCDDHHDQSPGDQSADPKEAQRGGDGGVHAESLRCSSIGTWPGCDATRASQPGIAS